MKLETKILVGLLALLVGTVTVSSIGPANVEWVRDTSYADGFTASGSDVTEGGNITYLNITGVNSSTERWAGYLGNLSSSGMLVILANSGGDIFYNWSWDGTQDGEVCAGTATSYAWDSLVAGAAADVDTVWSFADASDDAEATFVDTQTITVGANTVAAGPSANTGPLVADTFETSLLTDSGSPAAEGDFLFCTIVEYGTGTSYEGGVIDYELIVPVTYGATETYYFYLELN